MAESLERIRYVLSLHAPGVEFIETIDDNSALFVGERLAYLFREFEDGDCELVVQRADQKQAPLRLLKHEEWSTVAWIASLLEINHVAMIRQSVPLRLQERNSGPADTIIDVNSCLG